MIGLRLWLANIMKVEKGKGRTKVSINWAISNKKEIYIEDMGATKCVGFALKK